jgi:hypothetical protein
MTTKQRSGPVIHELKLEASVLEQRYKAGQVQAYGGIAQLLGIFAYFFLILHRKSC